MTDIKSLECELSMRGCDGYATTTIYDDDEPIRVCDPCHREWQAREERGRAQREYEKEEALRDAYWDRKLDEWKGK